MASAIEPHAERRRRILEVHPDVSKLCGPEWRSKWIALLLVVTQLAAAQAAPRLPWHAYLPFAYLVGASLAQALFLAVHELAHNLFFHKGLHNRLFSCVVNLPIGIPFAIAFRTYHLEHHKHQGRVGIDTDLPSDTECRVVGTSPLRKAVWLSLQIVAYAVRPCVVRPLPMTRLLALNAVIQLTFDGLVCLVWGWRPLAFMLLSVLLAGVHPTGGHFLSEHYVFPHKSQTQETYSYYGPLNAVCWNVGHHNEHHDFPFVPWSRLPKVRAVAAEFYDPLHTCTSWAGVMLEYVVRSDMGPHSRIKRR